MWWSKKTNETTCFKIKKRKKKTGGTIPREQSTISSWDLQLRIPVHSKSNTVTKLGFELHRLPCSGSFMPWSSICLISEGLAVTLLHQY